MIEWLIVAGLLMWIYYRDYAAAIERGHEHDRIRQTSADERSLTPTHKGLARHLGRNDEGADAQENQGPSSPCKFGGSARELPDDGKEGVEATLLSAARDRDLVTIRKLLGDNDDDFNGREDMGDLIGWTPLMIAATNDHVEIVRLLLNHGVNVNAKSTKLGRTALHLAGELSIVEMLLEKGADMNVKDDEGNTPLHLAVWDELEGKVAVLLSRGISVDSVNLKKYKPIHRLLEKLNTASHARRSVVDVVALHNIAQSLVRHGAQWDSSCELMCKRGSISLGFGLAIQTWFNEHTRGVEALTDIPEEVLRRGEESVQEYLTARHTSRKVHLQCEASSKGNRERVTSESDYVFRRKVCVVGPSFWGKTSLVKSIWSRKPSLEHPDDRTIGIDQFPMVFSERVMNDEELLMEAYRVRNMDAVRWLTDIKGVVEDRDSMGDAPEAALVGQRKQRRESSTPPDEVNMRSPSGVHEFFAESDIGEAQRQSAPGVDVASCGVHDPASAALPPSSTDQPAQGLNVSEHTPPASGPTYAAVNDRSVRRINSFRHHEVVFWDCAGHEAYQVAHSALFSRQALYLICVDLHAYAVALEHSELRANKGRDVDRLMDEFVDCKLLRWIRLILARQPAAEFVFVGTKADVLVKTNHRVINVHKDLKIRLKRYAMSIVSKTMPRDLGEKLGRRHCDSCTTLQSMDKLLYQALCASAKRLRNLEWLTVSCKDIESVKAASKAIEHIIVKSKRSFQMPELYSRVVDVISNRGIHLAEQQPSDQLAEGILTIPVVSLILRAEIPKHRANLSDDACQAILRTLHDIGDVLWYEDIGIDYLKNNVILHPLLVIEFVHQIARHSFLTEVMPHAHLKEQPYWVDLDPHRMLVMKQMLQHFNMVLPVDANMKWNSDLKVPAFWRSKESALWLFLGDLLANKPSLKDMEKDFFVQWEYHFTTPLPDMLFDQLVIESYVIQHEREAGPDWILYEVKKEFACRVVVTRAPQTFQRVLRVEAVASKSAGSTRWARFERLCEALERVLTRYTGLHVSRSYVDDKGNAGQLHSLVMEWVHMLPNQREPKCWLPPSLDWYYDNVMRGRIRAQAATPA